MDMWLRRTHVLKRRSGKYRFFIFLIFFCISKRYCSICMYFERNNFYYVHINGKEHLTINNYLLSFIKRQFIFIKNCNKLYFECSNILY